jgi:hypothetical protein
MTGFDPTTYDDNTLVEAIKSLRHSRSDYLGSWGKKRLACSNTKPTAGS